MEFGAVAFFPSVFFLPKTPSPWRRVVRMTCLSRARRGYLSLIYGRASSKTIGQHGGTLFAGNAALCKKIGGEGVLYVSSAVRDQLGVELHQCSGSTGTRCVYRVHIQNDATLGDASAILVMGIYAVYPGIQATIAIQV